MLRYDGIRNRLEMKVLGLFVLFQYIMDSGGWKREVYSVSVRLTLGSDGHETESWKQNAASGKRKGTDESRDHEVNT